MPEPALDLDAPAHRHRQFLADRQAQAATALAHRGARPVALLEALEQPRLLFDADARAGVGDLDAQPVAVLRRRDRQRNRTAAGELDRVAEQVQQDLPHPQRIALHRGRAGHGVVQIEAQPARLRQRRHQVDHFGDQRLQCERLRLQAQAPGLDPRQVQRVVDQVQQVRAGAADRLGVAALLGVQRRGQQQFAHAQHPGQRRAHLVAQRGQEAGLGQRGLFGQFLLVQGQFPGVLAAQAAPVGAQRHQQQQAGRGEQPDDAPDAAPPRRLHLERQAQRRRPRAIAGARLDLQHLRAVGQLRQGAFAAGAGADPVAVVARQAEPVDDVFGIDVRQQPHRHAQVAIVRAQGEVAARRQAQQARAAPHLHALHAQRQRHRHRIRLLGVQQRHAAVGGRGHQYPVGGHQQAAPDQFLAAEPVAGAERAHRRGAPRIDPEQAAAHAQPRAPLRIGDQCAGLGGRQPVGHRVALAALPPAAGAPPQFQPGQPVHPQRARVGEGERLHFLAGQFRRRAELAGRVVPLLELFGGHPRRAVRRHRQRRDVGAGQAVLAAGNVLQHAAVAIAHLHAIARCADPQPLARVQLQPGERAVRDRIGLAGGAGPALQRAAVQRATQQHAAAADPQRAARVVQHRQRASAGRAVGPVRRAQRTAGGIEAEHAGAGA